MINSNKKEDMRDNLEISMKICMFPNEDTSWKGQGVSPKMKLQKHEGFMDLELVCSCYNTF
jgi:hypothetical protein